jgi:hypothetical protein
MMDPLDTYRRMLTSRVDGSESAWWYLGTTIASPDGFEDVIVNHVETVMVYRAETLDGHSYRVPWWEIGLFRDAITGELPSTWTNPVTGVTIDAGRSFEEGPSGFSIRATGDGRLEIFDAVQAFADLDSATIDIAEIEGRVRITQVEHKIRSFPGPDGRIPDVSEGKAVRSRTVLQFIADRADLASDDDSVDATGMYSFELATPAWLAFGDVPTRFAVRGLMQKAPMQQPLNPRGWSDLQKLFPGCFEDGRLRPRWE